MAALKPMADTHAHGSPAAPTREEGPTAGRLILVMGSVGFVAAVFLVATYMFTLPIIEKNRAAYLSESITEVLPGAVRYAAFVASDSAGFVAAPDRSEGSRIFAGYNEADSLVGLAVEAQGQGYADVIRVLYGFDPECRCVVGLKILESKETPGIGDKAQKDPDFVAIFKRLETRVEADLATIELVKKGQKTQPYQIEAITGATVTSRALTNILAASTSKMIPLLADHLDQLRTPPAEGS